MNIQSQDPRNVVYAKQAPIRLQTQKVVRNALQGSILGPEQDLVLLATQENTRPLVRLHVASVQQANILGSELNHV